MKVTPLPQPGHVRPAPAAGLCPPGCLETAGLQVETFLAKEQGSYFTYFIEC